MLSLLERRPRLMFFMLGFLTTAVCFWLLANWFDIARGVVGMEVTFDTRPVWLRALMAAVQALPLAAVVVLSGIRLRRGPGVRPLAFAAGAVSVYALVVGSLLAGPAIEDQWHRRDFEAEVWRRNTSSNGMWPIRLTMVDDLLARHPLKGLSRDSVERLLGPRDVSEYWRQWDLVYRLGPERGLFRMDSEWLVLRLGSDRRVTDYQIVRD